MNNGTDLYIFDKSLVLRSNEPLNGTIVLLR